MRSNLRCSHKALNPAAATVAVNTVTLVEPIQADALCSVCHTKPRLGALTRCRSCLQAAVDVERKEREARQAKARKEAEQKAAPPATKACRSCKVVKPLSSFAKHRLAKDGHRHDCKHCVKTERAKRIEKSDAERQTEKRRAAEPHRRASNRAAVRAWTARNPEAACARVKHRRAVKSGKVKMAEHCEARGCSNSERLQAHHGDYNRPLRPPAGKAQL